MTTDNKEHETPDTAREKYKHASMVGTWFRSETFWQGVAASTLSTGIIAVGVVVAAFVTHAVELGAAILTLISFVAVISVAFTVILLIPAGKRAMDRIKSTVVNEDAHVSRIGVVASAVASVAVLVINYFIGMF
ncbi:hypothetical protein NEK97_02480 [Paenarthrobacter sp. UW852]|uniref:hypothetical protein n=1 Tax=Paenarthrobacter sp. UW852 TaxID=2951989 RepID=UPI0021478152|nr:hypothetical protein [Paenarthrobacter sp. UW852]MCR1160327.1 hypothetical protein [Paenarthrobacter sp. UW852]